MSLVTHTHVLVRARAHTHTHTHTHSKQNEEEESWSVTNRQSTVIITGYTDKLICSVIDLPPQSTVKPPSLLVGTSQ